MFSCEFCQIFKSIYSQNSSGWVLFNVNLTLDFEKYLCSTSFDTPFDTLVANFESTSIMYSGSTSIMYRQINLLTSLKIAFRPIMQALVYWLDWQTCLLERYFIFQSQPVARLLVRQIFLNIFTFTMLLFRLLSQSTSYMS